MSIKKGDTVVILAGKNSGSKGKVLRVIPKEGRVIVEGVNEYKRHMKPTRAGAKGQLVSKLGTLDISNAQYFCSSCGKGVRVGAKMVGDKKVRICKSCNVELA